MTLMRMMGKVCGVEKRKKWYAICFGVHTVNEYAINKSIPQFSNEISHYNGYNSSIRWSISLNLYRFLLATG